MNKVILRHEKVLIPTYETAPCDKNPMFLEKRVYQGSSGRVYPHPVCEGVANVKSDHYYDAVILENDWILVMILPELGGRIQRLYDKTNGYDAVYYNEVVKPALVGLAGPWISGGIEFNWPQHHRPSTFDPVSYRITENPDGSVTVTTGETEKMFHTKGEAAFTVYPDKAYLEIKGRLYNPTDRPQTFLWWANPAVAVGDTTRSIFPPDVNAVFDHGKRDVSKFPIADGVYYKVDYSPGTDISRYKNIPVPTSYMANHSDFNFIGNYDDAKEAGLLHVADHHVSPGKKQWTWGNGDFGRAWDRNLTDENGPYIELMTGVFTDNQPDFTFLKPYEEKTFTQYFMPYKACGAIKNANEEYAVNLEDENGEPVVTVYSAARHTDKPAVLTVSDKAGNIVYTTELCLDAAEFFKDTLNTSLSASELRFELTDKNAGKLIFSYEYKENEMPVPDPASPMPLPCDVKTNEELYLDALHLEQYRHATYSPKDYYLEGLKRDATDLRINNAYGRYLYNRGDFEESIGYFEAAVKKSTMRNPNPYDCEPFFNLGLALKKTGRTEKAFDAFYKAAWDGNLQDKAFFALAQISAGRGDYAEALAFVEKSLERGMHNMKARTLKTALLRLLGQSENAICFARETLSIDALDTGAYYELSLLCNENTDYADTFKRIMRNDNHNYIELSLPYSEAGLTETALDVLALAPEENEPLVHYYRFSLSDDRNELEAGEKASSLYCFPNRIEDIPVLEKAYTEGGLMAGYYLGCLLYDKERFEKSVELWENVCDKIQLPTVYRNLSLAYFNKYHDPDRALKALEKAYSMDESDVRILFELDSLYKILDYPADVRLEKLQKHEELLDKRDDLYTEFISLLNTTGRYSDALNRMNGHIFHPWEGGEGKITAEYRRSHIELAKLEKDDEAACKLLTEALTYPVNLGEGKLIGALDNDIYYYLGCRTKDSSESEKYLKLAARGSFELKSAMYYNDQPPEMMFYRALAMAKLGNRSEAKACFDAMKEYGNTHMNDVVRIDYFAVSLPDFLIFEGDLCKRNRKHCENMIKLGDEGLKSVC